MCESKTLLPEFLLEASGYEVHQFNKFVEVEVFIFFRQEITLVEFVLSGLTYTTNLGFVQDWIVVDEVNKGINLQSILHHEGGNGNP